VLYLVKRVRIQGALHPCVRLPTQHEVFFPTALFTSPGKGTLDEFPHNPRA